MTRHHYINGADPDGHDAESWEEPDSVGKVDTIAEGKTLIIDFGDADGEMVRRYTETSEIEASDLLRITFAPLRHLVAGLLVEGTTVLAAPPKIGKSCLVYQAAVEVALGGTLLGRQCERGSVLYLALEDGPRRAQARIRAALQGRHMSYGRLTIRTAAPIIGQGLEELLTDWLDSHPDAAMVAIDTLQLIRPSGDGRRNAYEVDVQDMGALQALFRDRHVVLLVVHHTRKDTSGDDFLTAVSGTYGVTGTADHILGLKRQRAEQLGILAITGRELPEEELTVRFADMRWEDAAGELVGASASRRAVYQAVRDHGPIMPVDIAKRTGTDRSAVRHLLRRLLADGAIAREDEGYVSVVDVLPDAALPSVVH